MKKILQRLFVSLLILSLSFINVTALINENVVEGTKQVVYEGGTNRTNDGISVSKIIKESSLENYFDITLKVSTESKIEEILKDQDLAIVIVMDVSNTMATSFGSTSRISAAQEAAKKFIDDFSEYSTNINAIRKLGFVAFNTHAHEIFNLSDCNYNTKENLKNTMMNKTGSIFSNLESYSVSHDRFTNIEGGLKMASDMLSETLVQNKYIIFLSDGLPTTYLNGNGYNGYDPYMTNISDVTSSKEGRFYNEITGAPCLYGTSYSDRAAIKARIIANKIKNKGTKIYSIGVGVDGQSFPDPNYGINAITKFSLVDYDKDKSNVPSLNNYHFEIGNSTSDYEEWLRTKIGSGTYYDVKNKDELFEAYSQIFEQVKQSSEEIADASWVVSDPMGTSGNVTHIDFVGFYDDVNKLNDSLSIENENQSDTANITENKITWDLKKSSYTTTTNGNVTKYNYEIKYRIRLENELEGFDVNNIYETNNTTTLSYVVRTNGVLSGQKNTNFPIPKVVGYLGNLSFTKVDIEGNPLSGAIFKLSHSNDCACMSEKKHPTDLTYTAVSDSNGLVTFSNIPSGHKYVLEETQTVEGFELSLDKYNILISYGDVSGIPENFQFINNYKTTDLKITKIVTGNIENSGVFNFKISFTHNNKPLNGSYEYKIGSEVKELVLENGAATISLKHNQSAIISGLPVNTTYNITELNAEGFDVFYELNGGTTYIGKKATCDASNECKLLDTSENTVKFINKGLYILPETGSSLELIMIIIGSLLSVTPIVYISYSFYKKRYL